MRAASEMAGDALLTALETSSANRGAVSKHAVPSRRLERWKYTPVASLLQGSWAKAAGPESVNWSDNLQPNPVPGLDAYRLVFVNGRFDASASDLPMSEGWSCLPASLKTTTGSDWFSALHSAHVQEGVEIRVDAGVKVDRPVLIHEVSTGEDRAAFPMHRIFLGANAEMELIFWHSSEADASGMSVSVLEAELGAGAVLSLDKAQDSKGQVHHLSYERVSQARDSRFRVSTMTVQAAWVRNDLEILLDGPGVECQLSGAFLPKDDEFVDNHTTVDHRMPDGVSRENYRGILYDKATGVFNGKVFVRPDAQKTEAYQQNGNILMSPRAKMNAKPELEIYADDVKCSHGCTIGQFDNEALFYLRSRGVTLEAAQGMLVQAFIGEVVDGMACDEVREEVRHRLAQRHGWQ